MMLEIIAFNVKSCVAIAASEADRIELCDNPQEGGTTPSAGFIQQARKIFPRALFPIIRPRGGDFLYTDQEFECMQTDILTCKKLGCDGVVIGMLTADGNVDKKRTAALVSLAYPMEVTFHRAFDRVPQAATALEDCIEIGCQRILTSGLYPTALAGAENLSQLIKQAQNRIIIMPGSGVRSANIEQIKNLTRATEFHSSARIQIPSAMQYNNSQLAENLSEYFVDETEINKMKTILNH